MSTPSTCPAIECWQALLDVDLQPEQRECYERHLEACPACQGRIDQAAACGDDLRRLADQVGDPTRVSAEPALLQVLAQLLEVKSPSRTSAAEPADLYFLQPTDRPDLLGRLGAFEVQEVIGQGGMGVVLKAFEPALQRLVAIKVLASVLAGSATARQRFTREARAAAAVCHDNVVAVHGVHEEDGLPYLVMQYVAGESLQDRLDRTGPLEVAEVVRIGLQTASGLAAAHAQGLIHRDIKPANLLLEAPSPPTPLPWHRRPVCGPSDTDGTSVPLGSQSRDAVDAVCGPSDTDGTSVPLGSQSRDAVDAVCGPSDTDGTSVPLGSQSRDAVDAVCGPSDTDGTSVPRERADLARVKITDFGLARMIDDVGLTQNGVVAGTPEYMAPEQARGEPIDHRADLFSLGSVLYALCTGAPPFRGATPLAVLCQVSEQVPTPIRSLNPHVPAWLETFIDRLLAKDPAGRLQSAAAAATLLEGYLAHLRQPTTVPAPELPPAGVQTRKAESPQGTSGGWRVRPSVALPILLFLAGVGSSVALWLQAAAQQPPPPFREIYQDFRGGRPLLPEFTLDGGDADKVARPEDGGLRITMPATRRNPGPVGARAAFQLAGDFEITGTFELLSADPPARGNGVGIALNIATDPELRNFAKLGRFLRVREGSVFLVESWNKDRPGNYRAQSEPTKARTGQLRLVREGPTLHYLVAEGPGNAFRELHQSEFGTGELTLLRFVVNNSGSPAGVDARLLDLKIRYGQRAADAADPVIAPSRKWLAATGLLVLFLVLAALGGWLSVRWRHRAPKAPAPPAAADEPARAEGAVLVTVRCSGCEKNLRTRSELAGKKVKCPQCGQAVRVPIRADGTAPDS